MNLLKVKSKKNNSENNKFYEKKLLFKIKKLIIIFK